jgi:hypothetical protein
MKRRLEERLAGKELITWLETATFHNKIEGGLLPRFFSNIS